MLNGYASRGLLRDYEPSDGNFSSTSLIPGPELSLSLAGTSKQKPQLVTKKQESGLDKQEAGAEADGDESDEAKESEADPEPGQLGSSSPGCGSSDSGSRYSAGHVTKAVASQTEPLRR